MDPTLHARRPRSRDGPWQRSNVQSGRGARACAQVSSVVADGIDPIEHRREQRIARNSAVVARRTFEQAAREYIKLHKAQWKNAKHGDQWLNTLVAYAFPSIGERDIDSINKADVLAILEPIWLVKHETATRVRQRLRAVLDWAAARDWRRNHTPALWDEIARSLPKLPKGKRVRHFAAARYADVPNIVRAIRASSANPTTRAALEFAILTACRSGEVRLATWGEFQKDRWTIPPARMKAHREHRVPLSKRARALVDAQSSPGKPEHLVFASPQGKVLSDMTLTALLRRLGYEFTVHGFRSSFRDWAAEQTATPRDVVEAALAHTIESKAEAAYFRSDLFEKRRELMNAWAAHCTRAAKR